MKINSIDNGLTNGLTNPSTFVGNANGMQNSEQQISDVNTFIFTIRTTSTKTVVLPLVSTGTYAFWVDWGDGIKDFVRAYSQIYSGETVARTHTYPLGLKDYTIKITGLCRGWSYYALTTEQPKLRSIQQFGCLRLINELTNGGYFGNCINNELLFVKDVLNLDGITNMFAVLAGTYRQVNLINNWNFSKVTSISYMFQNNPVFNQPLGGWNTGSITNMFGVFSGCPEFNQPLGSWNTGSVTNMTSMFSNTTKFNQPLDSWDVSQVTFMTSLFSGASAFDQDIGNWNIGAVTNITGFMSGKTPATFSAANLDAIYNGWSSRPSQSNLSISFGTANYTIAGGSAGRAILVSRGWTIVDGGGI